MATTMFSWKALVDEAALSWWTHNLMYPFYWLGSHVECFSLKCFYRYLLTPDTLVCFGVLDEILLGMHTLITGALTVWNLFYNTRTQLLVSAITMLYSLWESLVNVYITTGTSPFFMGEHQRFGLGHGFNSLGILGILRSESWWLANSHIIAST